MTLLTDDPSAARVFSAPGSTWAPVTGGPVPEAEKLWRLLGPAAPPWAAEGPGGSFERERLWAILDHSPCSQFDVIVRALSGGASLPDVVCLAMSGDGFHGQRNRQWEARRGNLHMTSLHGVDLCARAAQTGLTMLPAVAVCRAIDSLGVGARGVGIKWVNDVLLDDLKVGGVLTSTQILDDRIVGVVFGIGVNVATAPRISPTPFCKGAARLLDGADGSSGSEGVLPRLARAVVSELDAGLELLASGRVGELYEAYRSYASYLGREVAIYPERTEDFEQARPVAAGEVLELLPNLGLIVRGCPRVISRGRMSLGRPIDAGG